MNGSWGIQLLLACGLLSLLVGVLWPKLKPEEPSQREVPLAPSSVTVLQVNPVQSRYREQVRRSYRNLFGRWLHKTTAADLSAPESEDSPRKAA